MIKLGKHHVVIFTNEYDEYEINNKYYRYFDALVFRIYKNQPDCLVFAISNWDSEAKYYLAKAFKD